MKPQLFKSCFVAAALSLFYACTPDEQVTPSLDHVSQSANAVTCDELTFERAEMRDAAGFVSNVASAGGVTVGVQGFRRNSDGKTYSTNNYANLFNTTGTTPVPGSDDTDLMKAETGKVLIVNQDGRPAVPSDFANGAKMILDFSSVGSVTLTSLTYLDNEEDGTLINLYSADNKILKSVSVPKGADGNVQQIDLGNTAGVVRMEVILGSGTAGSGAIDNIKFCRQTQPPCDIITFENGATRNENFVTSVNSVDGATIGITGMRRNSDGTYGPTNYANLFNTTGTDKGNSDDTDLIQAETGKVLIVNQSSNADAPDDYANGARMTLDFSALGSVVLNSLTYLDNEEQGTVINLYDGENVLLKAIPVPVGADGNVQQINLGNTAGVVRMEVILGSGRAGSGAIDNIEFCPAPPKNGCTRTQGYWKNHASNSKHYDKTWALVGEKTLFFRSGETYYSILGVQPKGNAYYILAHQYVAATLNMKVASAPTAVQTAYAEATSLFTNNTPAMIDSNKSIRNQVTRLAGILDDYNNGKTGPGHCD